MQQPLLSKFFSTNILYLFPGSFQIHHPERYLGNQSKSRFSGIGSIGIPGDALVQHSGGGERDPPGRQRSTDHRRELRVGGDAERYRKSPDALPVSSGNAW